MIKKYKNAEPETLAVIPSILSNIFREFMTPTIQITVIAAFNASSSEIGITLFENTTHRPQRICEVNFSKGLVSKASSVNPMKKARHIPMKKKTKDELPNSFSCG